MFAANQIWLKQSISLQFASLISCKVHLSLSAGPAKLPCLHMPLNIKLDNEFFSQLVNSL